MRKEHACVSSSCPKTQDCASQFVSPCTHIISLILPKAYRSRCITHPPVKKKLSRKHRAEWVAERRDAVKDSTEGFGGAANLVKLLLSRDLGQISHYPYASNVCEVWEFTEGPSAAQPYLSCICLLVRAQQACSGRVLPDRPSFWPCPCQPFYSLSSWTSSLLVSSVGLALGPWLWTLQCFLLLLPNSAVLLVLLSSLFPSLAPTPTMALPGTGPPV